METKKIIDCKKFREALDKCRLAQLYRPVAKEVSLLGYTPPSCNVYKVLFDHCVMGKRTVFSGP